MTQHELLALLSRSLEARYALAQHGASCRYGWCLSQDLCNQAEPLWQADDKAWQVAWEALQAWQAEQRPIT